MDFHVDRTADVNYCFSMNLANERFRRFDRRHPCSGRWAITSLLNFTDLFHEPWRAIKTVLASRGTSCRCRTACPAAAECGPVSRPGGSNSSEGMTRSRIRIGEIALYSSTGAEMLAYFGDAVELVFLNVLG